MGPEALSVTHAEHETAQSRGQTRRLAGPSIAAAWYDAERRLLLSQLLDGVVFGVPVDRFAALATFDDDALCRLRVAPSGLLLLWEDPDADVSIDELLAHALSSPGMLRELARAGGRVRSEPKARAARANGARGGRPRKIL